jgi:hypothetical protein
MGGRADCSGRWDRCHKDRQDPAVVGWDTRHLVDEMGVESSSARYELRPRGLLTISPLSRATDPHDRRATTSDAFLASTGVFVMLSGT